MKMFPAVIVAAVLFGGLQAFQADDRQSHAATSKTTPLAGSYRLQANGGEASCAVRRGAEVSGGLSLLTVGPDCRSLLPGIERAKFWREREDGAVAFSETGSDVIVAFGVADGVDYESFEPHSPLISLAATN